MGVLFGTTSMIDLKFGMQLPYDKLLKLLCPPPGRGVTYCFCAVGVRHEALVSVR